MSITKEKIYSVAFRQLSENGYTNTSYRTIAEEAGCGRALVQYYFHHKEDIAIAFITALLRLIETEFADYKDPLERMLHSGQIYFQMLLSNQGMRAFTKDTLANRAITSQVLYVSATWGLPLFEEGSIKDKNVEASIQASGGVYDLLYRALKNNLMFDPAEAAANVVATYLTFTTDISYHEMFDRIKALLLGKGEATRIASRLLQNVCQRDSLFT